MSTLFFGGATLFRRYSGRRDAIPTLFRAVRRYSDVISTLFRGEIPRITPRQSSSKFLNIHLTKLTVQCAAFDKFYLQAWRRPAAEFHACNRWPLPEAGAALERGVCRSAASRLLAGSYYAARSLAR